MLLKGDEYFSDEILETLSDQFPDAQETMDGLVNDGIIKVESTIIEIERVAEDVFTFPLVIYNRCCIVYDSLYNI